MAQNIFVRDPNCGAWMKISGDLKKGEARCPYCRKTFDVPSNRSLAIPPQASTLEVYFAAVPFQCSKCGHRAHAVQPFAGKKAACLCGKVIKLPKKEVLELIAVNDFGRPDRSGLDRRIDDRRQSDSKVDRERRGGTDRRLNERRDDEE